ncbi:MAG TPA: DNA polymerase III subunit delta' [Candidatus Aminicenantes bacterium]|nr:DNA polymerase III subunit delta' [Candidatus Aminicenantes bacterium]
MSVAALSGNSRAKEILGRFLHNRRIPGSLLFVGPRGSNRLGFALEFAKALNCRAGGDDACDRCDICQAIDAGTSPDVTLMSPDGQNLKKKQIDEVVADAGKRPLQGAYRVWIIQEADRMHEGAANAFLKTLEEPLASDVFILLTHNLGLILPTIQSRCQIMKFSLPEFKEIEAHLIGRGFPAARSRLMAHFAGQADSVMELDPDVIDAKRGAELRNLTALLTRKGAEDVLLALSDRSRNRDEFLTYFTEMLQLHSVFLRDIMILSIGGPVESLVNADFADSLRELAKRVPRQKVFFLLQKMEWLQRDIQRNLNARVLVLEFFSSFSTVEGENVQRAFG